MKQSTISVLIVGAGPTGLMAAAQLQRFGINYRIIESREGTTPFSKALAVQSRTMEIYEQMGFVDKALPQGVKVQELHAMVKGQEVQTIPLSKVGADFTAYPFMFVLEQSKNEELIYQYILDRGGVVEWNTEMIDIEPKPTYNTVLVRHKDGSEETIVADWVIAADGGRSPIRHDLKIPFTGDTYNNIFYVVDTEVNWDKKHDNLYLNLSDNNFSGFFPIFDEKGKRFRIVGILPDNFKDTENITFEDIKHNIEELQHLDIEFGQTHWFSVYKVHHRCIERFKEGRILFAGDAAHVHSPAGGQGMNTGLQDAYNLAWKLALVVQGKAPESLLDSYNEERLPVAQKLVDTTDTAFSSIVKKGALINWMRLNILPFFMNKIMGINNIQRRAFRIVSQTGIRYKKSSISVGNAYLHKEAPHPGDRLPYLKIYNDVAETYQSIYELLGENNFHAIVWLSNKDKINNSDAAKISDYLNGEYPDLFQTHVFHDITENIDTFNQLHLTQSVLYIVRPDNYIGYIGKVDDLEGLKNYLRLILV